MAYDLVLTDQQEDHARQVYERATVIDSSIVIKYEEEFFERCEEGGVSSVNHTVTSPGNGFVESILEVNECRRWLEANAEKGALALSADDIRVAKDRNRVAVILGPQDASLIEDELAYLEIFYDLGVRIVQLTYQTRNLLGDGCGEKNDGGLTLLGYDVVKHMNELGMLVDLSHCGWQTSADAIEASSAPVVFSHSNPYAITPHVRNKSDDLIRALADKGGVMGITTFTPITSVEPGKRPSVVDVVTHIDYVADLVGIDHVGVGFDLNENMTRESTARLRAKHPELYYYTDGSGSFDYEEVHTEGLSSVACFPELTRALIARGYSDADIVKILGGNFLRVFEQVWDAS